MSSNANAEGNEPPEYMSLAAKHSHSIEFIGRAEDLIDQASRVVVQTDEDQDKAGDLLKFLKDLRGDIEDQRKKDVKPLNDAVKTINGWYKDMTAKLEDAIARVNGAFVTYEKAKQDRLQKQREEAALAAAEKDPEHADQYLDEGSKDLKPKAVTSSYGARTHIQRRLSAVHVTDWSKVPDSYKTLDEKKAKDAIKAGVEIPGVEGEWTETTVSR